MIEIYADGADIATVLRMNDDPAIDGFTYNPSLIKKLGVVDYLGFAKEVLSHVTEKSVSFEVLSDDREEMYEQAKKLAELAPNIFVKIPIMNTKELSCTSLMQRLSKEGVKVNATAITEYNQITDVTRALNTETPAIISIFAGRIADTLRDPIPYVKFALNRKCANQKVLWASCREVYNIVQAEEISTDIITVSSDILNKMDKMKHRTLYAVSLDTVRMFYDDAQKSGYTL